jgi:hypothetical protein
MRRTIANSATPITARRWSRPPPADEARVIENLGDKLLGALKNHRRYGTLVAADFSSFAAPEIMRVMREEKETRDICKR